MPKLNKETVIKSDDLNHGIYEWNSNVEYKVPALVFGEDGELYKSKKLSLNINPIKNPDYWDPIFKRLDDNIQKIALSLFPIGGVCAWPSNRVFPSFGLIWLECNGGMFDTVECPELYAVLGSDRVPDYQGFFLRGYGGNSSSIRCHPNRYSIKKRSFNYTLNIICR